MSDYQHRGSRSPGVSGYKGGCRCASCTEGNRLKKARQRARSKGIPALAPDPVRVAADLQMAAQQAAALLVAPRLGVAPAELAVVTPVTDSPAADEWRIWTAKGYPDAQSYAMTEQVACRDDDGITWNGRLGISYPAGRFSALQYTR